jgi:hypothetical protein
MRKVRDGDEAEGQGAENVVHSPPDRHWDDVDGEQNADDHERQGSQGGGQEGVNPAE